MYDIESLAYGFTTERAHVYSLPLTYPICQFEREATFYENYYEKIDFWWNVGRMLMSTDAKADRCINRHDNERSGLISTAEFLGITGKSGSLLGKADLMDLRYKGTSFKTFRKIRLVHLCERNKLNDPKDPIKKLAGKSISPNLFYYRACRPDELLFNFLWGDALQLPHQSYNIPDEFLAREARFLDHIRSLPKTTWRMNDYGRDLATIKRIWNASHF